MGGHGGLNILPQKRWNVYNFDNREKVRKDEEEAAKEEQFKREQSRKRDAEFRLEKLRQARGLASSSSSQSKSSISPAKSAAAAASAEPKSDSEPKSNHINLFEGIRIFDPVSVGVPREGEEEDEKRGKFKKMRKEAPALKVVTAEDEKYRLGYGVAGKGVKLPWYAAKPIGNDRDAVSNGDDDTGSEDKPEVKSSGKKTVEEMREERLKRERREKERERALVLEKRRAEGTVSRDRGYSRRYI